MGGHRARLLAVIAVALLVSGALFTYSELSSVQAATTASGSASASTVFDPATTITVSVPGPTTTSTSTQTVTTSVLGPTVTSTTTSMATASFTTTSNQTSATTATTTSTSTVTSTSVVTSTSTTTSTMVVQGIGCYADGQSCRALPANSTLHLSFSAPSWPSCFTIQLNGEMVGTTWTQFVVGVSNGTVTEGWEYWNFAGGVKNCPGSTPYGSSSYCWVGSGSGKAFGNMTLSPVESSPPVPAPAYYVLNVVGCQPGQPVNFASGTVVAVTVAGADWIVPNGLFPATAESSNLGALIVGDTVTFAP